MRLPLPAATLPATLAATLGFALSLASSAALGATLEVRFYPAQRLYAYAVDMQRGYASVLLQNVAVLYRSDTPVTVERLEIELLAGDEPRDVRRVVAEEIARSAGAMKALQAAKLLPVLAFQFGGEAFLGKEPRLAGSATLAPGEAVLIGHQLLTFKGRRERLRVRASGRAGASALEGIGELPIADDASRTVYRFPLEGTWFVGAGATPHTHHRWVVPQEFALDLVRLGANGYTHRGDGRRRQQYYAYGQPVRAAADGRVVAAVSDQRESDPDVRRPGESAADRLERVREAQMRRLTQAPVSILGNHVVIEHANGEYSVYAHLMPGSVSVRNGDRVSTGQRLARVGTSGNSTEPHLHFQVCDAPDPLACAGIPPRFANIELPLADDARPLQSGDVVRAE
jgi:murein DD-endopeptidase MepM/ murein hydrolase activator NlpD